MLKKRFFFLAAVIFFIFFIPWIPKLLLSTIEVTRLDSKGKPYFEKIGPGTKNWVKLNKVSKHFLNAMIVAEDGRFYDHPGIDLSEIYSSYQVNKKYGRYVRGASTITQQVVKMTCLNREKTIIRKIREILGALLLELLLSKNDILEWYVNLTEFGGGIYGIKAAGLHYFKTQPQLLTIEQAIALTSVIPNPNHWSTGLIKKSLSPQGHRRFLSIARRMYRQGFLTKLQWEKSLLTGNFGKPIHGYEQFIEIDPTKDDELQDSMEIFPEQPGETFREKGDEAWMFQSPIPTLTPQQQVPPPQILPTQTSLFSQPDHVKLTPEPGIRLQEVVPE